MTALRKRLIEELALRGYSPKTEEAYVHAVATLAQRYGRSPDALSDEEVRAYLLHLHLETSKSASTLNVIVSGLRFFYRWVLKRPFDHIERALPRVRRQIRRPQAYTREEIQRLFVLKRMLGHTSLSTTAGYLHLSREHLAKVKSPLDLLWES